MIAANCRITRARINLFEYLALKLPPRTIEIRPRASAPSVAIIATTIRIGRTVLIARIWYEGHGVAMRRFGGLDCQRFLYLTFFQIVLPDK